MIKNYDLEKRVLSGIIQHQKSWGEISTLIKEEDFYSEDSAFHSSIFKMLRASLNNASAVDDVILIEKLRQLNVSFPDSIDVPEYIRSLCYFKITFDVFESALKELKKITLRRNFLDSYQKASAFLKKADPTLSYQSIVDHLDKIHNDTISSFEDNDQKVINLSTRAEPLIEEIGNNPPKDVYLMSPYPTVNKIYGSIFRGGNITVIGARQKVGKEMPLYQKILTVDGWKDHGTIQVGDTVLTPNSGTAKVTGYFPHPNKDVYRVYFNDGRTADCGLEHLWSVYARDNRGNWVDQVLDTEGIIGHLKHKSKSVYIPLISGTLEKDVDFPIDPYIMGALLGDGCFRSGTICFSSDDKDILDYVGSNLPDGLELHKKGNSKLDYSISGGRKCRQKNKVTSEIKNFELFNLLSHEKFIPEIYFQGSFYQRERLLSGLIDTDGHRTIGNAVEFYSTSKKLAEDCVRLVYSVGGCAKIKIKQAYLNGIRHKDCYRVKIRLKSLKNECKRKSFERGKKLRLKIDKIELLPEKQDCACIQLDNTEQLYITTDYIVTHNTTMLVDCALKTSGETGVPVLHFDNGEMSENELIFRMVSGMSGIPMFLLESGKWRNCSYGNLSPQEVVDRVRSVWQKVKKTKILYESVAGMSGEEMCALLKRRYYSEVGRGNPLIFSFDYLKTDFGNLGKGSEWAFVGKVLHDFKQVISKQLKFDGIPAVSMLTSVQLNRTGIVTNRTADNVAETETEAAIGLSDNIIQFASHFFLLRKKTIDERTRYGETFGTHNLICLAARHLGEDMFAELNPIVTPEGPKRNFINLEFKNFNVEDRGDLRDIVGFLNNEDIRPIQNNDQELF